MRRDVPAHGVDRGHAETLAPEFARSSLACSDLRSASGSSFSSSFT